MKDGDIIMRVNKNSDDDDTPEVGACGRIVFSDEDGIIVDWFGNNAGSLYEPESSEVIVINDRHA